MFLGIGYDAFHLARAHQVRIGDGVRVFGECSPGVSADEVLRRHHLHVRAAETLDAEAEVTLKVWAA